jgi:hypothetical protein
MRATSIKKEVELGKGPNKPIEVLPNLKNFSAKWQDLEGEW